MNGLKLYSVLGKAAKGDTPRLSYDSEKGIVEFQGVIDVGTFVTNYARLDNTDIPFPGPVTLDDVSKRIDAICEAHLERCKTAQAAYSAELDALAAAVEASPDINQNAVGMIVIGRVKTLMTEVAQAIG